MKSLSLWTAILSVATRLALPADPLLLGEYPPYPPGPLGGDVALSEDRAYAAASTFGFVIFDVSDLRNPRRLAAYDTPGTVLDIEMAGTTAFVADDTAGLQILNVADPNNVSLIGSLPTIRAAAVMQVSPTLLYVADPGAGLRVVNIADLQSPQLIATVPFAGATSVAADGNVALIGSENGSVKIVTTQNPANPQAAGTFPGRAAEPRQVALRGNVAFAVEGTGGLTTFSVANPNAPALMGAFSEPGVLMRSIVLHGDYAIVGTTPAGTLVIDISDPFLPRKAAASAQTLHVYGVAVAGNHAFVAAGAGLDVIDISAPASPAFVASADSLLHSDAVAVSGNVLVSVGRIFRVFDVSNPQAPLLLGKADTGSEAGDFDIDVKIAGTIAYVAGGNRGLILVDISNPSQPAVLRVIRNITPGFRLTPHQITVDGNQVFGADGFYGFWIVDVTNPAAPVLVGQAPSIEPAYSLEVSGTYAYLGGNGGVRVIDISNPALQSEVDIRGATGGQVTDLHLAGTTLYAAAGDSGLAIFDVSNPRALSRLGGYDSPGLAVGVTAIGARVYLADSAGGILVLDASNPASPRRIGGVPIFAPASAIGVVVENDLLYLAAWNDGFQIFGGPPATLVAQLSQTGPTLTLLGEPGRDYRIQQTSALNTPWTDLGIFRSASPSQSIPVPETAEPHHFFRAASLP